MSYLQKLIVSVFALSLLAILIGPGSTAALALDDGPFQSEAESNGSAGDSRVYIVQLIDPPLASYHGGISDLAATNAAERGERKLDANSADSLAYLDYLSQRQAGTVLQASALLGRPVQPLFTYQAAFNGFAAEMTAAEAAIIAGMDGVAQVQPDKMRQLHTDVGPTWIGAPTIWNGSASGGTATKGEGITVGVIDTGFNLDHPSFAAVGPIDGFTHQNPLGAGNFLGLCKTQPTKFKCNNKLIGYYIFTGETTEDTQGHGSHTGSTAAGNTVSALFNIAPSNPFAYTANISGVAPHANIIGYDACLDDAGCPLVSLLDAIDQATLDGVDVINYSIGGSPNDPWLDADALAFLAAMDAGITPVTSAGNSGPAPSTLGSPGDAPWVLTVAASTHNRSSVTILGPLSGGGSQPPPNMSGQGLSTPYGPAPIVYAGDFGDAFCLNPFPAGAWTNGEIVVCDRGGIARVAKGSNVKAGGAGGLVLVNTLPGESVNADAHFIPAVHLDNDQGDLLKAWLATGTGHTASIQGTLFDFAPANGDIMAGFSSRGPVTITTNSVIKPDVTAPGVSVLAAYRSGSGPSGASDPWMSEYNFESGTSMSSPHTAGSAALIKALHPDWSPSEIKSALMTTAIRQVRKEDGVNPATYFDAGSGRVDLTAAARAGMIFDETADDFAAANPSNGGDPASLNLPSLANSHCADQCTWTRIVRNPTSVPLSFSPAYIGVGSADFLPSVLNLAPGASAQFEVRLDVSAAAKGQWQFGAITWAEASNLAPDVGLPVAVIPVEPQAELTVSNESIDSELGTGAVVTYTLVISNTGTTELNWEIVTNEADSLAANAVGETCTAPVEIPWLTAIIPAAGATPPDVSTPVQIVLDSTGLAPGQYDASICIESNAAATESLTIPVTLQVVTHAVIAAHPANLAAEQLPNQQTTQLVRISNPGGAALNWEVDESNLGGSASIASTASAQNTVTLYDQINSIGSNAFPSQFFLDFNGQTRGADDFVVPVVDGGWTIGQLIIPGLYTTGDGPARDFDINFYADKNGLPGDLVAGIDNLDPTSDLDGLVAFELPTPVELPPGVYWLSVVANMRFNPGTQQWFWATRVVQSGKPYAWEDTNGLLNKPQCATWKPGASVCGVGGGQDPDALFRILGRKGITPCVQRSDMPWAEVSPASGVTAKGGNAELVVTFDSTGLAEGFYVGHLCIESDAPGHGLTPISVRLKVVDELSPRLYLPVLLR
ncbi:MAG: S8 family serine peptidase [Caldilineales bacterium]|nr:S8 family serine peptidase [Caldilineales bacterium]